MKLTPLALQEQKDYDLLENTQYQYALKAYSESAKARYKIYGSYVGDKYTTRNMVKALRMFAWQNSPEDWARLHISEAALRLDRRKIWGLN